MINIYLTLTLEEYEFLQRRVLLQRNTDIDLSVGFGRPRMIKFYRRIFDKFGLDWEYRLRDNAKKFFREFPDGDLDLPDDPPYRSQLTNYKEV